ncbi:unnamed protein product [Cuscuta epithymum]|uniref:Magnesium-dependent phosphatase 1 n=1 Tax=Cuscuta epithymum TaxID=186058 RepID=A0AAV0DBY4_9ASTE|nr:unnamed protein product [Cuscuta epithymum]
MRDAFRIIKSFPSLPRLVVVDLDYTLWPFYCHSRSEHDYAELYPQAREILLALHEMGIGVAIASRTPTPNIARAFLLKLGLGSIFIAKEMFPSRSPKTEHFERIHRRTMVPYNQMLFFDDEKRNIDAASQMGVTGILVNNGINFKALYEGLLAFNQRNVPRPRHAFMMPHHHHVPHPQHASIIPHHYPTRIVRVPQPQVHGCCNVPHIAQPRPQGGCNIPCMHFEMMSLCGYHHHNHHHHHNNRHRHI